MHVSQFGLLLQLTDVADLISKFSAAVLLLCGEFQTGLEVLWIRESLLTLGGGAFGTQEHSKSKGDVSGSTEEVIHVVHGLHGGKNHFAPILNGSLVAPVVKGFPKGNKSLSEKLAECADE